MTPQLGTQTDAPKPAGKERIVWAKLLKRVFKIDIEKCPCGGTLRVVGVALYKKDIDPILKALGIPTVAPEPYAKSQERRRRMSVGHHRSRKRR